MQSVFGRSYKITEGAKREILRAVRWKCHLEKGSFSSMIISFLHESGKKARAKDMAESLRIEERKLRCILPQLKRKGLLAVDYDGEHAAYSLTREGRWMHLASELEVPFIGLLILSRLYCMHKTIYRSNETPCNYCYIINQHINYKYHLYSEEYLRKVVGYLVQRGYITRTGRDNLILMPESAARHLCRFDMELRELDEWSRELRRLGYEANIDCPIKRTIDISSSRTTEGAEAGHGYIHAHQ